MPEYIEREALKKAFKEKHDAIMQNEMYSKPRKWHEALGYSITLSLLENAPTADVVEVRHGEWKQNPHCKRIYYCSVCGRHIEDGSCNPLEHFPYCHCGAKMDGKGGCDE